MSSIRRGGWLLWVLPLVFLLVFFLYPLGSILAGGNSGPNGNDRAPAADWLALTRAFHAVAMEERPGHVRIPVLFGVDAVHGHSNLPGVTLYPHNIGLGAAHDTGLLRRIGEATAEEVAAVLWTVTDHHGSLYPSDHYPVMADFVF